MAFSSMSFSAGETPTLAKWNQLWENDDALRDGTGLANDSIGEANLVDGVFVPIGGVIDYWSGGGALPVNWEICDGSNVATSGSPLLGIAKPSMTDKFVRGVANQNLRTTPVTGGAASVNISHSHTVNNHAHGLGGHSHGYSGTTGWVQAWEGGGLNAGSNMPNAHYHYMAFTTGGPSGASDGSAPGTDAQLSSTQSILPSYVGMVKIVRVK